MPMIYLVEGSWSGYESQGYWAVRAFTTLASAEQYRDACQHYTEQYCQDFWAAFAAKFGEPAAGRDGCAIYEISAFDAETNQYPGVEFADAWFGYCYPDDHPGKMKMRAGSPDPQLEMLEGKPSRYRIVEVELVP